MKTLWTQFSKDYSDAVGSDETYEKEKSQNYKK